jgi:hypothetical protein
MKVRTDIERIEELLKYLKISRNALGVSIGESNGSKFNHIMSGRNGISEKLSKKIVDTYPEINYEWLMTGIGSMIKSDKDDNFIDTLKGDNINVDIIVDAILLNQDKFENNPRFKKYLQNFSNKAIIEYQEKLIAKYNNEK